MRPPQERLIENAMQIYRLYQEPQRLALNVDSCFFGRMGAIW